jgi:choline-sulfatase
MDITDLFKDGKRPNILIIITDQQRALQHFTGDFIKRLPAMQRIMAHGVSFEKAFTGACACSPGRTSLLTSMYPARHGTKVTHSEDPEIPMRIELQNLADVVRCAGYARRPWYGKWHLGFTVGPEAHGFTAWDAPDAGTTISNYGDLGGGSGEGRANDDRYLKDIQAFLAEKSADPFCMVASFINPHDVFVAFDGLTNKHGEVSGYDAADLEGVEELPPNAAGGGFNVPRAHIGMTWPDGDRPQHTKRQYVNFYANLQAKVDMQINAVLDALGDRINDTLIIRCADHGEMALSHNLLEKFYNGYEESIRVPLVFSNPRVWPEGQTSQALVSTVDLVPTLASLLGVTELPTSVDGRRKMPASFDGQDLSPCLLDPALTVQDHIHFTYDDSGPRKANPTDVTLPAIVRTIRTDRWKYSVYFLADGKDADWELYDLQNDELENTNLAGNPKYAATQRALDLKLQATMRRLGTMPTVFTWPPQATPLSRGYSSQTH